MAEWISQPDAWLALAATLADDFRFLRPWGLAVVAAALLLFFALGLRHRAARQWRGLVAPHLLAHLILKPPHRRRPGPRATLCLALALAGLVLAGPSWQREPPPFVEDLAPLVIALDLSETMDAVDVQPTRLARARQKIGELLAMRKGARTALVAFAGSAHTVLPLTDDPRILDSYLATLTTDTVPRPGRRTDLALARAGALLGEEAQPGSVLLVTDGIAPDDAALRAAAGLAPHQLLVWSFGTDAGGVIRRADGRYVAGADGSRRIAPFDRAAIERFVAGSDAVWVQAELGERDAQLIQLRVQSHLQEAVAGAANTRWRDSGHGLVIPIVLLAALSFRRGWTVG